MKPVVNLSQTKNQDHQCKSKPGVTDESSRVEPTKRPVIAQKQENQKKIINQQHEIQNNHQINPFQTVCIQVQPKILPQQQIIQCQAQPLVKQCQVIEVRVDQDGRKITPKIHSQQYSQDEDPTQVKQIIKNPPSQFITQEVVVQQKHQEKLQQPQQIIQQQQQQQQQYQYVQQPFEHNHPEIQSQPQQIVQQQSQQQQQISLKNLLNQIEDIKQKKEEQNIQQELNQLTVQQLHMIQQAIVNSNSKNNNVSMSIPNLTERPSIKNFSTANSVADIGSVQNDSYCLKQNELVKQITVFQKLQNDLRKEKSEIETKYVELDQKFKHADIENLKLNNIVTELQKILQTKNIEVIQLKRSQQQYQQPSCEDLAVDLAQENQALLADLKQNIEKIQELEKEMESLKQQNKHLSLELLNQNLSQNLNFGSQIQQQQQEILQLKQHNQQLISDNKNLLEKVNILLKDNEYWSSELQQVKIQNEQLQNTAATATSVNSVANNQANTICENNNQTFSQQQQNAKEDQKVTLSNNEEELIRKINELEQQLEKERSEKNEIMLKLNIMVEDNENILIVNEQKTQQIEIQQQSIQNYVNQINNLQIEIETIQRDIVDQNTMHAWKEKIDYFEQIIDEINNQNMQYREDLQQRDQENKQLLNQCNLLQQRLDENETFTQNNGNNLDGVMHNSMIESNTLKSQLNQVRQINLNLKAENKSLFEMLKMRKQEIDNLTNEKSSLQQQLQNPIIQLKK